MQTNFDRVISVTIAAATVFCAGVLLRREILREAPVDGRASMVPIYIRDWERALAYAVTYGNPKGAVQLVEFTDFECPFCRRFHENTLPRVIEAFPDSVGWSLVHFPLPMHRFAKVASRAFECGGVSGSPSQALAELLYAKQDSFGLKSWSSFAADAGLPDTARFAECTLSNRPFVRIDSGGALATHFGVQGTPGVMVNGWLFPRPPTDSILISTARMLLARGNTLPDVVAPRRR